LSLSTSLDPMRPFPPMTTIVMSCLSLEMVRRPRPASPPRGSAQPWHRGARRQPMGCARDLDRPAHIGAMGHEALERGGDVTVPLADQQFISPRTVEQLVGRAALWGGCGFDECGDELRRI
jgi:hypothetical protein